MAEQKARMAQQAAEKERAEAGMMEQRAQMHERGMADDELVDEHERDRFADVVDPRQDRDGDGHTMDDRARDADPPRRRRRPARAPDAAPTSPGDYQQGREDERRFERSRITDDVRESDRTPAVAHEHGCSGAAGLDPAAALRQPAGASPPRP